MVFGFSVNGQPGDDPQEIDDGRDDKRTSPTHRGAGNGDRGELCHDEGKTPGHENPADVGTGIKQTGGQGTLAFGEPFGGRLDGGGEIAALTQAEQDAADEEAGDGTAEDVPDLGRKRMRHRRQAPEGTGKDESPAQAHHVHQPAHDEHADRVGGAEGHLHVPVILFGPTKGLSQFGSQVAKDAAVDVVGGGDPEQQRTDHPPVVRHSLRIGRRCGTRLPGSCQISSFILRL